MITLPVLLQGTSHSQTRGRRCFLGEKKSILMKKKYVSIFLKKISFFNNFPIYCKYRNGKILCDAQKKNNTKHNFFIISNFLRKKIISIQKPSWFVNDRALRREGRIACEYVSFLIITYMVH